MRDWAKYIGGSGRAMTLLNKPFLLEDKLLHYLTYTSGIRGIFSKDDKLFH